MDTNQKLREFMEAIQQIRPPYGSLSHNGVPAAGQSNVAAERVQELYRISAAFAQAYQNPGITLNEITARGEAVERMLMGIVTLGAVQQDQADRILDMLLDLTAEKGLTNESGI